MAPRSRVPAYAPVGYHSATGANPEEEGELESGKTLILAAGFGWLYGLGCVIGPFYGVGVGLTFPGGVLAGAGGGVGIVIGVGAGAGGVWGSGRGSVLGYSVSPPMNPPFSSLIASAWGLGRSRSWLAGEPPEVELRLRAAVNGFRRSVGRQLGSLQRPRLNLLQERQPLSTEMGFVMPPHVVIWPISGWSANCQQCCCRNIKRAPLLKLLPRLQEDTPYIARNRCILEGRTVTH